MENPNRVDAHQARSERGETKAGKHWRRCNEPRVIESITQIIFAGQNQFEIIILAKKDS